MAFSNDIGTEDALPGARLESPLGASTLWEVFASLILITPSTQCTVGPHLIAPLQTLGQCRIRSITVIDYSSRLEWACSIGKPGGVTKPASYARPASFEQPSQRHSCSLRQPCRLRLCKL